MYVDRHSGPVSEWELGSPQFQCVNVWWEKRSSIVVLSLDLSSRHHVSWCCCSLLSWFVLFCFRLYFIYCSLGDLQCLSLPLTEEWPWPIWWPLRTTIDKPVASMLQSSCCFSGSCVLWYNLSIFFIASCVRWLKVQLLTHEDCLYNCY